VCILFVGASSGTLNQFSVCWFFEPLMSEFSFSNFASEPLSVLHNTMSRVLTQNSALPEVNDLGWEYTPLCGTDCSHGLPPSSCVGRCFLGRSRCEVSLSLETLSCSSHCAPCLDFLSASPSQTAYQHVVDVLYLSASPVSG